MLRARYIVAIVPLLAVLMAGASAAAAAAGSVARSQALPAARSAAPAARSAAPAARSPVAPTASAAGTGLARWLAPLRARWSPRWIKGDYDGTLLGDSCVSTTFCLAVGFLVSPSESLVPGLSQRWDGAQWYNTGLPGLAGPNDYVTYPDAVSCSATGNCLTVGEHYTKPRKTVMFAENWTYTGWNIVKWANPRGVKSGGLSDVSCVGPSVCMMVGYSQGKATHGFVEEWDYPAWKRFSPPAPPHARSSELASVSCASPTDCMAVGNYVNASRQVRGFAYLWDGAAWRLLAVPGVKGERRSYLESVSCPDVTLCVAVGDAHKPGVHPFAETWTGGRWEVAAVPGSRAGGALFGVSCPATSFCMASGYHGRAPLTLSWDGTAWRTLRIARTSGVRNADVLVHVSCVSTTNCEAVGFRYNPRRRYSNDPLAELWNGQRWTVQPTSTP